MTAPLAIDTSVAVPLLVHARVAHQDVVRRWDRREVALAGYPLAETYAVLTRLPGDLRVAPPLLMGDETVRRLPQVLSRLWAAVGAVYDALVALAAAEHRAGLAPCDALARGTYQRVGVLVAMAG